MKFEKHLKVTDLESLGPLGSAPKIVDLLVKETALSKPHIKQTMTKGAVWVSSKKGTRRVRRADKTIKPGEEVHLYYDQQVLEQEASPAILISDQGDYSIWYKPSGMYCQGSKWGDHCTIHRWVEIHHQPQKPAFIVHRLDRAACGLIILAHKKKTAAYFSSLFEKREIEKRYQAIVIGEFTDALVLEADIDGKPAYTEATLAGYQLDLNRSLLDIKIKTGRKHQIRKHLVQAGFPILGDRLYGPEGQTDKGNLRLQSCFLSFVCPMEQVVKEYRLPKELQLSL